MIDTKELAFALKRKWNITTTDPLERPSLYNVVDVSVIDIEIFLSRWVEEALYGRENMERYYELIEQAKAIASGETPDAVLTTKFYGFRKGTGMQYIYYQLQKALFEHRLNLMFPKVDDGSD